MAAGSGTPAAAGLEAAHQGPAFHRETCVQICVSPFGIWPLQVSPLFPGHTQLVSIVTGIISREFEAPQSPYLSTGMRPSLQLLYFFRSFSSSEASFGLKAQKVKGS